MHENIKDEEVNMDKVIMAIDKCGVDEKEIKRLIYNGVESKEIKNCLLEKKLKLKELFNEIVLLFPQFVNFRLVKSSLWEASVTCKYCSYFESEIIEIRSKVSKGKSKLWIIFCQID